MCSKVCFLEYRRGLSISIFIYCWLNQECEYFFNRNSAFLTIAMPLIEVLLTLMCNNCWKLLCEQNNNRSEKKIAFRLQKCCFYAIQWKTWKLYAIFRIYYQTKWSSTGANFPQSTYGNSHRINHLHQNVCMQSQSSQRRKYSRPKFLFIAIDCIWLLPKTTFCFEFSFSFVERPNFQADRFLIPSISFVY